MSGFSFSFLWFFDVAFRAMSCFLFLFLFYFSGVLFRKFTDILAHPVMHTLPVPLLRFLRPQHLPQILADIKMKYIINTPKIKTEIKTPSTLIIIIIKPRLKNFPLQTQTHTANTKSRSCTTKCPSSCTRSRRHSRRARAARGHGTVQSRRWPRS